MVMLEIISNGVLVEAMTSQKDSKMQQSYLALLEGLKRARIVPTKHVLDNELLDEIQNEEPHQEHMQAQTRAPGLPLTEHCGGRHQGLQATFSEYTRRPSSSERPKLPYAAANTDVK